MCTERAKPKSNNMRSSTRARKRARKLLHYGDKAPTARYAHFVRNTRARERAVLYYGDNAYGDNAPTALISTEVTQYARVRVPVALDLRLELIRRDVGVADNCLPVCSG